MVSLILSNTFVILNTHCPPIRCALTDRSQTLLRLECQSIFEKNDSLTSDISRFVVEQVGVSQTRYGPAD